jgi:hypothetical protein
MFFPFSSPVDLEELMCRRSKELRTGGRLKNSPLLAILAQLRLSIILEVSIFVLIESAAVWRFCRALVGGKRE